MEIKSDRLTLIDSLRGVAASWVMLYHFYNALLPEKDYQLFWKPIDYFLQLGHLGVFIFFVLSGFVINFSLSSKKMTGSFFFRFLFRRSIRLDIPYWVVIWMTGVSVLVMSDYGLSRRENFQFSDYLLNMLYADNLLNTKSIVAVGWTLQYEIQFYLFFALLLYLFTKFHLERFRDSILLVTFIVSLSYWFDWFPFYRKTLFLDYWFCFLLGSFVCDVINGRTPARYYFIAVGLTVVHAIIDEDSAAVAAIVTSLLLFYAGKFNGFSSWLNWKPLLFLGSISYSLYLLHPFFGNRIIRFINYRSQLSLMSSVGVYFGIILLTLFLVWVFYRLIEYPSHRLSRKIRL